MQLSKAQQYVATKHSLDALWESMSEPERTEARGGLDWLSVIGGGNGPVKRGRPRGSKTKTKAQPEADKIADEFGI